MVIGLGADSERPAQPRYDQECELNRMCLRCCQAAKFEMRSGMALAERRDNIII